MKTFNVFSLTTFLLLALISTTASAKQLAIGDHQYGGIIFYLTPDKQHGLVAETINQSESNWYEAPNFTSMPSLHSKAGKNYVDWRLPSHYELSVMNNNIGFGAAPPLKNVGRFAVGQNYWSSSEDGNNPDFAGTIEFVGRGNPHYNYFHSIGKNETTKIRAIRSF